MIELFVITFGRPDLLREQKRLLDKYVEDPFALTVIDNSKHEGERQIIEGVARDLGLGYHAVPSEKHEHPDGLNMAARIAHEQAFAYWGTIDHDVFPRSPTSLLALIEPAGFFGIGQRHGPSDALYIFPGFAFWSREWLAGRIPDYGGIRGEHKRDDGDCGSLLAPLFTDEDWERLPKVEHGYGQLRRPDDSGLQSWGYEILATTFVHFTNASHWRQIPNWDERQRLLSEMLRGL